MDTLHGAAVDGFLDFFLGGTGRIMNFGYILVVQAKNFRADLHAEATRNTLLLIYHHSFAHKTSPYQETRTSMTGTCEQVRTLSATLPRAHRLKPLRPWVAMAIS